MTASTWLWVFQRLSAVVLVVLLALHMAVQHYVDPVAEITFLGVTSRLRPLGVFIIDWVLLMLALFHGLNGLRGVIRDWWPRATRAANWVLTGVGVAATVYGGLALAAFRP